MARDYSKPYFNLGYLYKAAFDLVEAEAHYLIATKLDTNFGIAHFNLGNTQKEMG